MKEINEIITEYDADGNIIRKASKTKSVPEDLAILKYLSEMPSENIIMDKVYTHEEMLESLMKIIPPSLPQKATGYLTRLGEIMLIDIDAHDKQVRAETAREIGNMLCKAYEYNVKKQTECIKIGYGTDAVAFGMIASTIRRIEVELSEQYKESNIS